MSEQEIQELVDDAAEIIFLVDDAAEIIFQKTEVEWIDCLIAARALVEAGWRPRGVP